MSDLADLTGNQAAVNDDVAYGIDGGYSGIYDGIIIWALKDGRLVNRFAGEGGRREARIDELIREMQEVVTE